MRFDSAKYWAVSGHGIVSLPDHWVPEYAEVHPDMIVFEAELTNPRTINSSPVGGTKFICTGLNCSVYVFGASADGVCFECGSYGEQVSPQMARELIEWYETARSRPFHNS